MQLKAGQKLRWEGISDTEVRIIVEANNEADPLKALGFCAKHPNGAARTTEEWIREIRVGE